MPSRLRSPAHALGPAALLLAAVACGERRVTPAPTATPAPARVRLVDPVEVEVSDGQTLHRVELLGMRVDTIPGVWAEDEPTIVGDTAVLGLALARDGTPTAMFRYHLRQRTLVRLPVHPDLRSGMSGVAVSPDGRWIAYARFDGALGVTAVVRPFPAGRRARRSPRLEVAARDGRLAWAEWHDAATPVVLVDGLADDRRWLRLRGDTRIWRWVVDTIDVEQDPSPPLPAQRSEAP